VRGACVDLSTHKKDFIAKYHMSETSFNGLIDLLAPHLHVDGIKSRNCTGGNHPIDLRMMVAAGLRWLGGEQHKSLTDILDSDDGLVYRHNPRCQSGFCAVPLQTSVVLLQPSSAYLLVGCRQSSSYSLFHRHV
jgi:hypothetical protein